MNQPSSPMPDSVSPDGPHWEVQTDESGSLTATLVGLHPPIMVSAPDLDSLRKQIRNLMFKAMM